MQSQTVSGFGIGVVRPEEVAELAARVGGPVFVPGQPGYVEECVSYNLNLVLEPALVVEVTSTADVQVAVRFAVQRGLPVAVNATGHQISCVRHTSSTDQHSTYDRGDHRRGGADCAGRMRGCAGNR
jgi:hypothetical protein